MKPLIFLFVAALPLAASAQQTLKILSPVWDALAPEERATIQKTNIVDLRDPIAYALIIDNQGVDESSPGTNLGAHLGGVIASAAYIDRAFKPGNNYSVGAQLAIGLLGAVAGSTLDKPATTQFHFRYALKRYDGEIMYRDNIQGDAFRHPVGMCIEIASLSPAPQALCTQSATEIRAAHLPVRSASVAAGMVPAGPQISEPAKESGVQVECKIGTQAPIFTTQTKCNIVGGRTL